ncbi:MAG TPA: type II toxin-antitoxin system Phd/YefM family antitoxin [Spirochaetia bacterium]|nr:type II toxin-antitoxin system Phd/YefM family antitoxin [Spirochaetia bacterium]
MKTMQIGELKTHFSQVLERVKRGEKIVIAYGKGKENVAVIVPYSEYKGSDAITLGLLQGKASYSFSDDFAMTSEELIGQ